MIDVTDQSFENDVLAESMKRPVVVDLWAPWCGPCRTLGPLIEKVVAETDGKVLLAKINVDENTAASQAFRVQSIPAVYALQDGQIVDGFMGAKPEAEIREFIQKLVPSGDKAAIADLLLVGDEESLVAVLELEADNEEAITALARLLIEEHKGAEALAFLERIPANDERSELAALARTAFDETNNEDAQIEAKLSALLDLVASDTDARSEFVDLLTVLGADNPATADWRSKLSAKLY